MCFETPFPDPAQQAFRVDDAQQQKPKEQAKDAPTARGTRESILRPARTRKKTVVVALGPQTEAVDSRAALLHGILAEGALVAGVIVNDPFPPERGHGVQIKGDPAPTGGFAQTGTRSGIETDPALLGE